MNIRFKFCPHCGSELVVASIEGHNYKVCSRSEFAEHPDGDYDGDEGAESEGLASSETPRKCSFVHWNNPVPVAVTIIPRRHRVVLVRRRKEPKAGLWCPPCGFVNEGESPSLGAVREAGEESGLSVSVAKRVLKMVSLKEVNEIIFFFRARNFAGRLQHGSDALEVGWFSQDDLPPLAFDTHREVLAQWFDRPVVRGWRRLAIVAAYLGIKL